MADADPRLTPAPLSAVPGLLAEGADLWNAAQYWHAHEAWETAWHALRAAGRADEAAWLQGLILATAGFENLRRRKVAGFRRQVAHALHRLRAHRGRGRALGLADEDAFVEALTDAYLDAARRTNLAGFEGLAKGPPALAFDAVRADETLK